MDDITSKLGEMLNNPESMEKLKNLVSMFNGAAGPSPAAPNSTDASPPPEKPEKNSPEPEVDKGSLEMIMKFAPLLSRARQEDDSTRLLRCLRPFLSEPKRKKLDEAIRLMQIVRMIPFLKNSGLF